MSIVPPLMVKVPAVVPNAEALLIFNCPLLNVKPPVKVFIPLKVVVPVLLIKLPLVPLIIPERVKAALVAFGLNVNALASKFMVLLNVDGVLEAVLKVYPAEPIITLLGVVLKVVGIVTVPPCKLLKLATFVEPELGQAKLGATLADVAH